MNPTEVCITIDTEFGIAGAFGNYERGGPIADPLVYGPVRDREEGLGFLLKCFARHRIPATFFVEALNPAYFGPEPMGLVVRRILSAGQDVQLHLHPAWLKFREPGWRQIRRPSDSLVGRPLDEAVRILRTGIETLRAWGAKDPVAFRAGNLAADMLTYRALREVGILVASNLGVAYNPPADRELHMRGGRRRIEGVVEMPVLTYRDWRGDRILTVTGTGVAETRALLWKARRAGLQTVVVLTHPFEFFKHRDDRYTQLRRNRVNQHRLVSLCRFLRDHPEDFVARSFGDAAKDWQAEGERPCPPITAPFFASVSRLVQNKVNDTLWFY